VPKGWKIIETQVLCPENSKPRYIVLLTKEEEEKEEKATIGFRSTNGKSKSTRHH
jgi:hypothetical protein|tara:strand:+ start:7148 stop:7312 length:165 start_codon:yes stop_codon:yes gene_type:complete